MSRCFLFAVITLIASVLVACGPSKSVRATQTQAAVNATTISAAATKQYELRYVRDIGYLCGDLTLPSFDIKAPVQNPRVVWVMEFFTPVPDLDYIPGDEYALLIPDGWRTSFEDAMPADTLLCVHRLRVKYEPDCVYNTWLGLPTEPKTLHRYRIDSTAYLIDPATSGLQAVKEFPGSIEPECPLSYRFEIESTQGVGYFGEVELETILDWAKGIWQP